MEPSRRALCKRLLKGLCNGSITQEVVMEYARGTKPIPVSRSILKVGSTPRPEPVPRVRFDIPAPRAKPIPTPRTKSIPAPRTRPVPIPRKVLRKIRPTPPPRTKSIPASRTRPTPPPRAKPISPPRRDKEATCDHGTLEEIDGVIFCVLCGLETDHNPYRQVSSYRETQRFVFEREPFGRWKEPVPPLRTKPPENVNMVSKYEKARY